MRIFEPLLMTTLLAATALAGCGDDDGSGAGSPDAGPEDPDGDPGAESDELLIGTWQLIDDETGDVASEYTFAADGRFTFTESGEESEGTYQVTGTELMMTSADGTIAFTYHADEEAFMTAALLPDGEVDGFVGRWTGTISIDSPTLQVDSEMTFELRADGSATIQGRQDGTPIDSEGTWTEESGQVVVSFPYEDANVNLHLDALPDRALGGPLYQRVSAAARNDRQNR